MPVPGATLKSWAMGAKAKPKDIDLGPEDGDPGDDLLDDGEVQDRNPVWAGELGPEEIDEMSAEDLIGWLEENEPEIHAALVSFVKAVLEGDPVAEEEAEAELQRAAQFLNPEYEPLTDDQKEVAKSTIAEHMRSKGGPGAGSKDWKQAVAIGLAEARRGDTNGGKQSSAGSGPDPEPAPRDRGRDGRGGGAGPQVAARGVRRPL